MNLLIKNIALLPMEGEQTIIEVLTFILKETQ